MSGDDNVGGLVGINLGTIEASYASGAVSGDESVGGLAGDNSLGTIEASYATGAVSGDDCVGGLAGGNNTGTITASYATGAVSGNDCVGGLVGDNTGTITASYWDTETSGLSTSTGGDGKMTSELQSPTSHTGIFATWDSDAWDFGTSSQYPALKGLPISVDEQRQSHPAGDSVVPPVAPAIGTVTPGTGTLAVSWTAPSSDGGSAITAYDLRHIETSADETVDSNWTVVDDVWTVGGGMLQHTLTKLTGSTQYGIQIRAVNSVGDGSWSATATGIPTMTIDYDTDDDGLIEITSAAQLNAVRWDPDGDGAPASANASDYAAGFPNAAAGMGCPSSGCTGYELNANIDLDVAPYNTGRGWDPIGNDDSRFRTIFDGNGNTIFGLFINRPQRGTTTSDGLFGVVGREGTIQNLGLLGVDVTGGSWVGGLVGRNLGTITASYVTGLGLTGNIVDGFVLAGVSGSVAGGITGYNRGTINASYSTTAVLSENDAGGLVGWNHGTITASYAIGLVLADDVSGGLVAVNVTNQIGEGNVISSYWDTTTSSQSSSDGGVGKTTSELQSPTDYSGIYANWKRGR